LGERPISISHWETEEKQPMTIPAAGRAAAFRALHDPGRLLILANAWDAGSARLIESCGATAIATTSAGLAWSRGYADGNAVPARVLAAAVAEIARVVSVPLTVDAEQGYSDDPSSVAETVMALIDAGAVGINIEDGAASPDLLCAKIEAVKQAAIRAGVDLFVNARTDVYLRRLVPAERAVEEVAARARAYRSAGCDGLFVPRLADADAIRAVVAAVDPLPLNLMAVPDLPPAAELRALGVRRLSAGSAIAEAASGLARRLATAFLADGRSSELSSPTAVEWSAMNALFAKPGGD
jgi:2-methylisocitrate lyase-like PEP mutase family enzyme